MRVFGESFNFVHHRRIFYNPFAFPSLHRIKMFLACTIPGNPPGHSTPVSLWETSVMFVSGLTAFLILMNSTEIGDKIMPKKGKKGGAKREE